MVPTSAFRAPIPFMSSEIGGPSEVYPFHKSFGSAGWCQPWRYVKGMSKKWSGTSRFREVHSLSAACIKSYHSPSGIIRRDLVACRDNNQESEGLNKGENDSVPVNDRNVLDRPRDVSCVFLGFLLRVAGRTKTALPAASCPLLHTVLRGRFGADLSSSGLSVS